MPYGGPLRPWRTDAPAARPSAPLRVEGRAASVPMKRRQLVRSSISVLR